MANLSLNIIVVPTFNVETMAINDVSTYTSDPPVVTSPTIEITPPGFDRVILPFSVNEMNTFTSISLGLSEIDEPLLPIPDGVYQLKYSVAPAYTYYVEKSIMRIDKIQEKFDSAFMKLDIMTCDRALKLQSMSNLLSIYFFIQGSVAAANNCAVDEANTLYATANRMLDNFLNNDCGC